jgi:hypothetical protein
MISSCTKAEEYSQVYKEANAKRVHEHIEKCGFGSVEKQLWSSFASVLRAGRSLPGWFFCVDGGVEDDWSLANLLYLDKDDVMLFLKSQVCTK